MPQLRLNQTVAWRSGGIDKTGIVIAVIPPNKNPNTRRYRFAASAHRRNHESYVVRGGPAGDRQDKFYWPQVALLNPIETLTELELNWCRANAASARRLIDACMRLARSKTISSIILTFDKSRC